MPELDFEIVSAEVKPYAAVPTLLFKMLISNKNEEEEVFAAALRCQVLIEATRRSYDEESKTDLREVFGDPDRWEETVRGLMWTTVTIPVNRFRKSAIVEIAIPVYEDHITAAGKYFYSIKKGEIPLAFLFSGTLFYAGTNGGIQITQVPWHKEASYRMPADLWKKMMDIYFPGSRWVRLSAETFDRIYKYKAGNNFTSTEDCLEWLLKESLQMHHAKKEMI
jgi:hypothetical protein